MSTPTKRRKKNDHQASAQPVKSLDFFFGKQQAAKQEANEKDETTTNDRAQAENGGDELAGQVGEEETLTDEQLARKLQREWDEADRAAAQNGNDTVGDDSQRDVETLQAEKVGGSGDAVNGKASIPAGEAQPDPPSQPHANAFAAMGKKNTLSLQSATAEEDTTSHTVPFDQSPLTFDPQDYLPALKKQWASENGSVTYALLTRCFVLVNSTQSRIKIVDTLVNLLRTIIEGDPESLLPAVWLATNSISPPYIDLELGLGGSAISKALKKVCGLDNAGLKTLYNKYGDAGDVAFEAKKRQSLTLRKPKPLTIKAVFESLVKIANSKGHGSQEVKQRIVERLVQDARGAEESRYIVRTLVQHLRIGAVKTTMLIALSRAFLLSAPPNAPWTPTPSGPLRNLPKQSLAETLLPGEELVKASFARRPNYSDLIPTLLSHGLAPTLLAHCGLALHIPLRPMLGGITRDLGELHARLGDHRAFACEFKYDGQRAQVHCDDDGKVSIFSRHLELMTDKYPDLVALVPEMRGEGVGSFILEGEVVAVDRGTGELRPFQVLANRARKEVGGVEGVKVEVCLFAFDLMFLNGGSLLGRSLRERRGLLRTRFRRVEGRFDWVRSLDAVAGEEERVREFFQQATEIKCEGIMVKVLDNPVVEGAGGVEAEAEGAGEGSPAPVAVKMPPTPTKGMKKGKTKKGGGGGGGGKANQEATAADAEKKPFSRRKPLLATYEPDKRLDSWLKVKKDYNTSADTIDLIPVGGWHGQGRKNAWWSPILLACRNEVTGSLEVVTKCISGFTDAFYKANRARYDPDFTPAENDEGQGEKEEGDDDDDGKYGKNCISRPSYVDYAGEPDVWFEPQEVWEMAFADVTLSPTYTAAMGLVSLERGLSLRFPRFLRVREDKGLEEASSSEFLAGLWRKQEARVPEGGGGEAKEEGDGGGVDDDGDGGDGEVDELYE
ncbi:hypothetical protein MBLNU230_g1382t1 [Neophaeotheca triangularis]